MSVNMMWSLEESIQIHDVVYRWRRGLQSDADAIKGIAKILSIRIKDAETVLYNL